MDDLAGMKAGDAVGLAKDGRAFSGTIRMASANGRSLAIDCAGAEHVPGGMLFLLQDKDGQYRDLLTGAVVTVVALTRFSQEVPGYWMNEMGGVLRPGVLAYLNGDAMTPEQIAAMRAYLRQWIAAPGWIGPVVDELRMEIEGLTDQRAIRRWLNKAEAAGIDPL